MKKRLCIVSILTILLSACNKAPVREPVAGTELEEVQNGYYIYADKALEEMKEIRGKKIGNLEISEEINIPEQINVSTYKVTKCKVDDFGEIDDVVEKIWPDYYRIDKTNTEGETYTGIDPEYIGYGFHSSDRKYTYVSDSNGYIYFNSGISFETSYEIVDEYDPEWGMTIPEDVEYELSDGKMKVSEAVAFTEETCNKNLYGFERGIDGYKVQHLYVVKNNDKYSYILIVGKIIDGLPLDTAIEYYDSQDNNSEYAFSGSQFYVIINSKDKISYFHNGNYLMNIDKKEDYDKLLSPLSALKVVEDEIADVAIGKLDQCGLVYLMKQKRIVVDGIQMAFSIDSEEETELRPFWMFSKGNDDINGYNGNNDYHGTTILIDALDGSAFYFDASTQY